MHVMPLPTSVTPSNMPLPLLPFKVANQTSFRKHPALTSCSPYSTHRTCGTRQLYLCAPVSRAGIFLMSSCIPSTFQNSLKITLFNECVLVMMIVTQLRGPSRCQYEKWSGFKSNNTMYSSQWVRHVLGPSPSSCDLIAVTTLWLMGVTSVLQKSERRLWEVQGHTAGN